MKFGRLILVVVALCVAMCANATEWYVSAGSGNDDSDGDSWAQAKQTIQNAVSWASAGDTVWVGDGTYNIGTTISPGYSSSNRVVITRNTTVRSLNGPDVTIIEGAGPVGPTAVRGVYMIAGTLSGFTITNGHTKNGGMETFDQSGGGVFCTSDTPEVNNCIFSNNKAEEGGGGMANGTASGCTFGENTADEGGGMLNGTANYCTFIDNSASFGGGKAYGTANHCTFSENNAALGGGLGNSTANQCVFSGNEATVWGGGMYQGTAFNGLFLGNRSDADGGGMYDGTALNCTFSLNSANYGGGLALGTANNCIVWDNTASINGNNLYSTTVNYSCSPDATSGAGNKTTNPQFVDAGAGDYRLQSTSPCINVGHNGVVTYNTDLAGNPRKISSVDMGAYEFVEDLDESPTHYVREGNSGAAWPYTNWPTAAATIQAAVDAASENDTVRVDDGTYDARKIVTPGSLSFNRVVITKDLTVLSENGPGATVIEGAGPMGPAAVRGIYMSAGTFSGFTVTNGFAEHGGGIFCPDAVPVVTNCTVSGNAATSIGGGMRGGTASDCTFSGNSAKEGAGLIFGMANTCIFSNNTATDYGGGMLQGTANYCTFSENSATYQGGGMIFGTANHCTFSQNRTDLGGGMYGGTANNCTFSENEARNGGGSHSGSLNDCTLSNNEASDSGGGSYGGTLNRCELTDNRALSSISTSGGGGSYEGTLNNCLLSGNFGFTGGGSRNGTLNNCTLSDNSAVNVGGCNESTLNNCIIYGNAAVNGGNILGCTLNSCWTTDPLFVDADGGDFHLQASSLCIDVGDNSVVSGTVDLDGNTRIVNSIVDMGAYEYAVAGMTDSDGDGMSDVDELIAGTSISDSNDYFRVESVITTGSQTTLGWNAKDGRSYSIWWAATLSDDFQSVHSGIHYPVGTYTVQQTEPKGFYLMKVEQE